MSTLLADAEAAADTQEGAAVEQPIRADEKPVDAAVKKAADEKAASEKKTREEAAAKTKADAEAKASKVPDKYDLKLPDGSGLDDSAVERTAALARKLGLSNERAQELLNHESESSTARNTAAVEELKARSTEWAEEVKSDKDLGGDNLPKTTANIKRAMDKFGTDKLRADLNATGFGNYPEFVRFVNSVGAAMGEDKLVQGGPGGSSMRTEDALYPTMKK